MGVQVNRDVTIRDSIGALFCFSKHQDVIEPKGFTVKVKAIGFLKVYYALAVELIN